MEAEGWYRDPYGVHDDRWFSGGDPTALVRDGVVESHDEPPADLQPTTQLIEVPEKNFTAGADLRRADDDNEENDPAYSPSSIIRRVVDDAAEVNWG